MNIKQCLRGGLHCGVSLFLIALGGCALMVATGCYHCRSVAAAEVQGGAALVKTRFRYDCVNGMFYRQPDYNDWLNGREDGWFQKKARSLQPFVFAEGGIPIVIDAVSQRRDLYGDKTCWRWASGLTLGMVPVVDGSVGLCTLNLYLCDGKSSAASFRLFVRNDSSFTCFPFPGPLLFCNGDGLGEATWARGRQVDGMAIKVEHDRGLYGKGILGDVFPDGDVERAVVAYAVAVKLKELEDSGVITEATLRMAHSVYEKRKHRIQQVAAEQIRRQPAVAARVDWNSRPHANVIQGPQPMRPEWWVDSFAWEPDKDYSCVALVALRGSCTLEAFSAIEEKFREYVGNSYLKSHPAASGNRIVIDVRPSLKDGKIQVRADVLTFVVQGRYDSIARRGRLSVKYNAGLSDDVAKAYARKYIEALARDKNIVLVEGEIPPAARFTTGDERLVDTSEGKILEIDFKTE